MVATVAAVHTPTERRRRPVASARVPSTGASTASTSPASPTDHASQLFALTDPGRSSPTASVRYTENTNVRMIVLKAADPQSHIAHASTRPRGTGAEGDGLVTDATVGRCTDSSGGPA